MLSGSIGRLVFGLVLGGALGVAGLPRLDLSAVQSRLSSSSSQGAAEPVAGGGQDAPTPSAASPTSEAVAPTPTVEPMPTVVLAPTVVPAPTVVLAPTVQAAPTAVAQPTLVAVAGASSVHIDEHFGTALADWPDDPDGTAWFAGGAYRLYARQPDRFVAVGVPLHDAVGDVVLSAQFRKVGGYAGGGYGLILRDQSVASDRDGRGQGGRYLVVGVGDRGDVGIWQRDGTHWIDVVPWTHSDAVHQDLETNSLVATTHGATVRFEVNGQVVAEVTYTGLPVTGGLGIFVGGDFNQVALEWLRIDS